MDSRRQPGRNRRLAPTKGVAVLIVHPDDELRRAMRAVVSAAPGFDPVRDAATAEEALELAVLLRPPLALVAMEMPGIDGFETSERLVDALSDITVVLLGRSTDSRDEALARARAVAAVSVDELTPGSLPTLWDERVNGSVLLRFARRAVAASRRPGSSPLRP
jgi:DNA-binding NarL/FixJ family response regulator